MLKIINSAVSGAWATVDQAVGCLLTAASALAIVPAMNGSSSFFGICREIIS
jgi:hypothetical protein